MEEAVTAGLLLAIGTLLMDEFKEIRGPSFDHSKRLCDYRCAGSTFEPVSAALARGIRLIEVHVYSDAQDRPVVALKSGNKGDTVSFESICVTLVNEAFPSSFPLILSIVPHTSTTFTLNKIAHDLSTTLHKKFLKTEEAVEGMLLGALADKLIIVSGPEVRGSNLEPLVNLSWAGRVCVVSSMPRQSTPATRLNLSRSMRITFRWWRRILRLIRRADTTMSTSTDASGTFLLAEARLDLCSCKKYSTLLINGKVISLDQARHANKAQFAEGHVSRCRDEEGGEHLQEAQEGRCVRAG